MAHVGMGVAVLVGFDCYLRTSAIAELQATDATSLGEVVRRQASTLVSLAHGKTG